ncbi:MAG: hypothetical protein AB1918_06235 [Pseudomonadota bacterium]
MKTLTKTIVALASVLLVAGCTAAAQDATAPKAFGPGYGPGWRHEQMVQAWEKGELPAGPGMMRGRGFGPGMRGYGPGAAAIGPDGKVDTSKLPPWCPYSTAPDAAKDGVK